MDATEITQRATPPGPGGHVLHGNLAEFMTGRLAFLERMARNYGDVVRYRLGDHVAYLINDPALVRQVLADWDGVDNALTNGWLYLDQSYLAIHGRARAQPRSLLHAAISPRPIAARHAALVSCVERRCASWPHGGSIDALRELMELSVELISEALFARPALSWMGALFDDLADVQLMGGAYHEKSPELAERLSVPQRLKVFQTLVAAIEALLAELPPEPEANALSLAHLLRARDAQQLTPIGLVHELGVLVLSHTSIGVAAMSAVLHLAQHPEVREKLEAELWRVLGSRAITPDDFAQLPYLQQVLDESMRLLPAVGLIPRQVVTDFECGGYRIPSGSELHISPYLLHRHPRHWLEPERFWPERFDRERARSHEAYLPFGLSIRRCIGDQLSLIHLKLLLGTLLRRVRLDLGADAPRYDVAPMGVCYPVAVELPVNVARVDRPLLGAAG
jgi:cytochrome P450